MSKEAAPRPWADAYDADRLVVCLAIAELERIQEQEELIAICPFSRARLIEQREGISAARVGEVFAHVVHGDLKQSSSRGAGVQRC